MPPEPGPSPIHDRPTGLPELRHPNPLFMRVCDPVSADADLMFERYLRHGRSFGVDAAFWSNAFEDLTRPELERLGKELGVKVPREVECPAAASSGTDWHRDQVDEQLRREWERWRYRRSKLSPEQRGPMMEVGQRQCKYEYDAGRPILHRARAAKSAPPAWPVTTD
jgi:hypothetical protein